MMTNNLGLYVHIPFCERKCNYCDFNSSVSKEGQRSKYLKTLIEEIKRVSLSYKNNNVDSIFIGGGTPSILSVNEITVLVSALKDNFSIENNLEFTIEANPNSIDEEKLKTYLGIGINRISFGAQSFQDKELEILGRIHRAKDIYKVINLSKKVGFKNVSLDLMEGIPLQTMDSFMDSLNKAVELDVNHISVYGLIIEEDTIFYKWYKEGTLSLPSEETERKMYRECKRFLKDNEYFQYEISNFSKKGFESKHNLKYWEGKDYLGLGLGSHSKVNNKRFENVSSYSDYLDLIKNNKSTIINIENLKEQDLINEYIVFGIRKTKGINLLGFKKTFNLNFLKEYSQEIDKNVKNGYIKVNDDYLFLTDLGMDFSNKVELDFYR